MAPIHHAANQGDLEEVIRLIQEDPGVVDITDDDGIGGAALHYASKNGHVEVACYLLDQGADINARSCFGSTPLFVVCGSEYLRMVELLMSRGADPTTATSKSRWTPLMAATYHEHVAAVRHLLGIRAMRATSSIDAQNTHGKTTLWWAARKGRVEILKMPVEAGVNLMMANNDGTTPMEIAQYRGHPHCIELLRVSIRRDGLSVRIGEMHLYV